MPVMPKNSMPIFGQPSHKSCFEIIWSRMWFRSNMKIWFNIYASMLIIQYNTCSYNNVISKSIIDPYPYLSQDLEISWVPKIGNSKNYSQKDLGVLRGDFWGFGCPNDTQTPCWLRLCAFHMNHCVIIEWYYYLHA